MSTVFKNMNSVWLCGAKTVHLGTYLCWHQDLYLRPWISRTANWILGKVSTPENSVLLIFYHICPRSIRPFQVLSVFITCCISSKVKVFSTAWVPMKLMNSSTADGVSRWSPNGCIEIYSAGLFSFPGPCTTLYS